MSCRNCVSCETCYGLRCGSDGLQCKWTPSVVHYNGQDSWRRRLTIALAYFGDEAGDALVHRDAFGLGFVTQDDAMPHHGMYQGADVVVGYMALT